MDPCPFAKRRGSEEFVQRRSQWVGVPGQFFTCDFDPLSERLVPARSFDITPRSQTR